MRAFVLRLLLAYGLLTATAAAQTAAHASERAFALAGDAACPIGLPPGPDDGWTEAERWAWDRVCRGRYADMRFAAGNGRDSFPCNPAKIEGDVPNHRRLRPEFLQLILTRTKWVEALAKPQIRIRCAWLERELDLENARVSPELGLFDSYLKNGARLYGARFDRSLIFQGATFRGPFSADNLSVKGDLFLSGGATFEKGVDLLGAQLGGDLSAIGSTFNGPFNADRLSVAGGLFLRDGATFKEVRLLGAQLGGSLEADGSTFNGPFHGSNLSVAGGLYLRGGATFEKEVRLLGAQVGGNLDAIGATFNGPFNADGLSVRGSLYLRDGATFKEVGLSGATIEGHLQLAGSRFTGIVDFSGGKAQELVLFRPGTVDKSKWGAESDDPVWKKGGQLILRNANVTAVQSRARSWQRDGEWITADLSGFTYDRLAGFRAARADTLLDETATTLVDWLAGTKAGDDGYDPPSHPVYDDYVSAGDDGYDPQPFEQLAGALAHAGMTAKARAVRYAKFRYRDQAHHGPWWETWILWPLSRFVTGYGVYPFWALFWFAGLVATGFFVAHFSHARLLQPRYRKFWYSLGNALPLAEFSAQHNSVKHGRGWVESWFHFQKAMGFVLATVLIGALYLLAQ